MSRHFNMRLDEDLRERAFAVIQRYGLTPAQAVKLFFNQIADTQSIPLTFNHHAPKPLNEAAQRSLQEARAEFATAAAYDSIEALHASLWHQDAND